MMFVNRHNPRMLQLAADLGFLDEPADQFRLLLVRLEQDLDRQVAAEVRISALQDRPHAAAGDLTEQLQPPGPVAGRGHLRRTRLDYWRGTVPELRVAKQHPRQAADRLVQCGQRARHGGSRAQERPRVNRRAVAGQSFLKQADRAETIQGPMRQDVPAPSTAVFGIHGRSSRTLDGFPYYWEKKKTTGVTGSELASAQCRHLPQVHAWNDHLVPGSGIEHEALRPDQRQGLIGDLIGKKKTRSAQLFNHRPRRR